MKRAASSERWIVLVDPGESSDTASPSGIYSGRGDITQLVKDLFMRLFHVFSDFFSTDKRAAARSNLSIE